MLHDKLYVSLKICILAIAKIKKKNLELEPTSTKKFQLCGHLAKDSTATLQPSSKNTGTKTVHKLQMMMATILRFQ